MHVRIKGRDADYIPECLRAKPGGELLLKDGTRYSFDVVDILYMGISPPDINNNLIEIESLAHGAGKWMLGSEPLYEWLEKVQQAALGRLNTARSKQQFTCIKLYEFFSKVAESPQLHFRNQSEQEEAIVRRINSEFFTPPYVRRWGLRELLQIYDHNKTLKHEVCAAAWFEGEGNRTPLLLRSFSEIKSSRTVEAEAKLRSAEIRCEKAEQTASMTLREALGKWMRFDPPRMAANTKARIEKAVKLYLTDPDKHSLAKIAAEFKVAPKTVSTWFAKFSKETGFPVVRHVRHESVQEHLRAKNEQERQQGPPDESSGSPIGE